MFRRKVFVFIAGAIICGIVLEAAVRISGLVFSAVMQSRNERRLRAGGSYTILCIGESTTAMTSFDHDDSWPAQLSEVLNRPGSGIRCVVINKGVPTSDTNYLRAHLEEELDRYRPDMVVTMMGINDEYIQYYKGIPDDLLFRHSSAYRLARILAQHVAEKWGRTSVQAVRDPSEATVHAIRGDRYYQQHRYDEAVIEFRKAIEVDPGTVNHYLQLGITYEAMSELDKMRDTYRQVTEKFPRSAEGYIGLGWHAMQVSDYRSAVGHFRQALVIAPERDDIWNGLGWAYRSLGDSNAAAQALREAISHNPANDKAYAGIALISEFDLSSPEQAREYAARAAQVRRQRVNPATRANYHAVRDMVRGRGIALACMQYPLRPLESLKAVFSPVPGDVIWVDNEDCFRKALQTHRYEELFSDMFGGEFGHCTAKGNRVIAENLAGVIEGFIRSAQGGK